MTHQPELEKVLRGQRAFVTGHTGFTGSWLALWLQNIGCEVFGLALPPVTEPNLFSAAEIGDDISSQFDDIRDFAAVKQAIDRARPSVVFHLAAQPLVSRGFVEPVETLATNVIGTAHVLEASRLSPSVKGLVCVTTDKVYAELETQRGHREGDQLGGRDPYAASKAAAELVADCYRSTMVTRANGMLLATARGGNIIGGGDWSKDRIVPDFVRAVTSSSPLSLRNPSAVRPWQHVLSLVHGYLQLAAGLLAGQKDYADAWNFGPLDSDAVSVQALIERLGSNWKKPDLVLSKGTFPETTFLRLDSAKARNKLGWCSPLNFDDTVALTAEWYRDYYARPSSARALTVAQIDRYRQQIGSTR